MGWTCHLFLFYGALGAFMRDEWDHVNVPPGGDQAPWMDAIRASFENGHLPSIPDMLNKARGESGGVTVYACTASCRALGLEATAVRERVDEVVGLPTMLQVAEKATHVMYI